MIADHWDERIGRNVKGPGVVPVLSETPGHHPQRRLRRGPVSTTTRSTAACSAGPTPSSTRCERRACYDRVADSTSTIREVVPARRSADRGADPVVRQARTARGRRRDRRARGRGHRVRVAVEGARAGRRRRTRRRTARQVSTTSSSPRWWPARTAPSAPSRPACDRSSTWCRRPTDTAGPTSAGPPPKPTALIADIIAHRPRQRRDGRGHRRHRVGLPVRRADRRRSGCSTSSSAARRQRRRPAGDRRHHRHHDAATGQRPGRARAPADRRHSRSARTSTTPAAPDWPARTPPSARASPGSTPRSAASAAARSRPAPAATSPPRTWCTCCGTAGFDVDVDLQAAIAAAERRADRRRPRAAQRAAARRRSLLG